MPDNRLTLTIEAQNLAQAAFKQFQTDVRQSNEALQKAGQAGRQSSSGIKVFRDELGRFHNVATGRYISAAQVIQQGFQVIEKGATQANQRGLMPFERGTESFAKGVDAAAASLSEGFADAFLGVPKAARPANEALVRMRREFEFLRNDIHNTAAVSRQFAGALQSQVRAQFDAAASLERLQVSLVTISGSTAAATQQYNRLLEAARLPGINLQNSLRASLQLQAIGKSGQEAKTIIEEFGNAFALAGGSGQQLGGVVHGIRQIISDGKVLQRELNIITSRIAILTPIMQEAFGGNRAEDVRAFAESIGRGNDTVGVFFEAILKGLKELPRAGNTAANAIENLGDSYERAQASIGGNFLPIVKEATAALEGVFKVVERSPGLARSIAIFEALGGTFLAVTAAAAGFAAALPAVAAGLAFLATNPIGLTIVAVAALTAGLVALKVASQDVETQVERLATTFDELDTALRKNHEAIQSNQQAQVESTKSSLTIQRDAIRQHITLLEEERASIERSIEANRKRAEQGLLPIASTGESFGTQLDNANARLEVTQHRLQEVNDALRANEEAAVPIQKATVNIDTLTKAVTRLKAELEEETTFEGISQSVTGDPAGFRSSAQALADIETLLRVNVDRFKELREAAASGNQEAATALSKLNQQFEGLRDTQADRHVDNLAAAFEKLTKTTDPSRKQLEAILKSADAFVQIFQGGADVVQDDVTRALGLISQVREQLQALSEDELRLETHDIGAQGLTDALLRFYDLQSTVQEDAKIDAQRSAEKQATAYIRAYRDSIDPAVLNVVESVKLLREEVRGTIQDLERVQAQDTLKLDVRGEIGGDQRDALAELFDLNQAVQGNITQNQIENYRKRVDALAQTLADETLNLQAHIPEVEALQERLRDARLSLLEGEIQERDALYEDDLKAQSQVEEAKRQGNEKTYDYNVFLLALRRKSIEEATQEFVRLEERALDASSQRQRENLIRETQQFADAYAQRGNAFRDLVTDAQELGGELREAFDLTEQQKRLEDFQDSVAGVLDNLAGIAIDHIFDSFSDSAQRATDAVGTFVDEVRGELQLLQNDITRLTRFDEDQGVRRQRLIEDRDRRLAQLQRERQTLAARSPTGDQGAIERNTQRQQDLTARITRLREDFGVRLSRFDEDTDRRRSRTIEDATQRRENFESRGTDDSLVSKLVGSLTSSLSNTLSSTISSALAGALTGALQSPFQSLIEGIKGLFGGGAGTTPAVTTESTAPALEGDADVDGTIKTLTVDPTLATPNIDVAGVVKSAMQAAAEAYTMPNIDVVGAIKSAVVDAAYVPVAVEVKGLITSVMLAPDLTIPTVSLPGVVNQLSIDPAAVIPTVSPAASLKEFSTDPAAVIPTVAPKAVITDISTDANATVPVINPAGVIRDLSVSADAETPGVSLSGAITSLTTDPAAVIPTVHPRGEIDTLAVSPTAVLPDIDLTADITALNKSFTEPIPLQARADVELNIPDVPALNAKVTFTPDVTGLAEAVKEALETPDTPDSGRGGLSPNESADEDDPTLPPSRAAAVARFEERRQKIFGSGNETVQTSITPEELTRALIEGNQETNERSGLFDLPRTIAEGIGRLGSFILGSGLIGVGAGDVSGSSQVDRVNADVASSLKAEDSPRSDFVVTLSPNVFTNQGTSDADDTGDDDDTTARAPAAIRFDDAADAINTAANLIGASALAGVAQDDTLRFAVTSLSFIDEQTKLTSDLLAQSKSVLDRILYETRRVADAPLVEKLVEAGVTFPRERQDLISSPIPDILTNPGINLLAGYDNIDRNLQTLLDAQAYAQGAPDLSVMPGGDPSNPMYIIDVNRDTPRDVRIVNTPRMVVEGGVLDGVKNPVDVKQVGVVQVTQSGEWVMRLASGQTIPVYVQGGSVQANLSQGGISTLAELIDVENQRRDAFNTAI